MRTKNKEENILDLHKVNQILSETLLGLSERKISPRRAQGISRVALALSKNITHVDLKDRIELLEQLLKERN